MCVCVLSCVWLSATLCTVVRQVPLSMGFSRQEYWSALPFSPPADPPNPGIELVPPVSLAFAGRFFTSEPPGKHIKIYFKLILCTCILWMLVMMLLEFTGTQRFMSAWLIAAILWKSYIKQCRYKDKLFTCATKIHEMIINLILLFILYGPELHFCIRTLRLRICQENAWNWIIISIKLDHSHH